MRLAIRYIYYRLYTWHFNVLGNKDLPALSAFLQLTILIFINLLLVILPIAMFLYPRIFNCDNVIIIGIGPLIMISLFLYLVLFRKRNSQAMINEFELMNKTKKSMLEKRIIYYAIMTSVLSFVLIAFLSGNI